MKNTFSLILIIALVASIGGVYWYRTTLERPAELPSVPTGSALELIERLHRINLDTMLFQDRAFLDLVSFVPPPIENLKLGNPNPFSFSQILPASSARKQDF